MNNINEGVTPSLTTVLIITLFKLQFLQFTIARSKIRSIITMTTPTTTTSAALRLRSEFLQPTQFNLPGATPFNNEKEDSSKHVPHVSEYHWAEQVCTATQWLIAFNSNTIRNGGDTQLLDYLDTTIDEAERYGSHIVIAGDLNVYNQSWLGSSKTTRAGELIEKICSLHGLYQHVTSPTRSSHMLDLVISNFTSPVDTSIFPLWGTPTTHQSL